MNAVSASQRQHRSIIAAPRCDWNTMAARSRLKGRPLPRLLELRESRFLTQEELATMTGLERSTIARIELGGSARFSSIKALAKALQVEPRELLGEPGVTG